LPLKAPQHPPPLRNPYCVGMLATGCNDGNVRVYTTAKGALVYTLPPGIPDASECGGRKLAAIGLFIPTLLVCWRDLAVPVTALRFRPAAASKTKNVLLAGSEFSREWWRSLSPPQYEDPPPRRRRRPDLPLARYLRQVHQPHLGARQPGVLRGLPRRRPRLCNSGQADLCARLRRGHARRDRNALGRRRGRHARPLEPHLLA
jgi:hypothetical protein